MGLTRMLHPILFSSQKSKPTIILYHMNWWVHGREIVSPSRDLTSSSSDLSDIARSRAAPVRLRWNVSCVRDCAPALFIYLLLFI
jgi:hypothetical protein